MIDATHKISLWVENDEGLLEMAKDCGSYDTYEDVFREYIYSMATGFARELLEDFLNDVDWQMVYRDAVAE